MSVSKSSPSLLNLRATLQHLGTSSALVARLARSIAGEQHGEEGGGGGGRSEDGGDTLPLARSLERLRSTRRSVEAMIGLGEAAILSEDELVVTTLRQHEQALEARAVADNRCAVEKRQIEELKRDVAELERSIAREEREQVRIRTKSGAEREQALERRCTAAEATLATLQEENQKITSELTVAAMKNNSLGAQITRLEEDHRFAIGENKLATRILGNDPCLEAFRRTAVQECSVADEHFARTCAECEAGIARLGAEWHEQQVKYLNNLQELNEEVRDIKARLGEKQTHTDAALSQQTELKITALEEAEARNATEMQRMDEVRQQKAMALRKEVATARQYLQEASIGNQRLLDAQLNEAKLAYQAKVKTEEVKCEQAIESERFLVANSKKQRVCLEKKVVRVRENYRGHAIKNTSYMKSLGSGRRQELVDM